MKKTWYYRLLFSYMPVFLLIISFLFFIFFQILSERAQQDAASVYTSINNQSLQTVEQTLQSIDHLMVTKQTRNNNPSDFNMLDFFNQSGQPATYFTYQVTQEFNNMKQLNPYIHSLYLVRDSDGYVLSSNTVAPLQAFADHEFIKGLMKDTYSYHWTDKRLFKEFGTSRMEAVVSLARKYVTSSGESGLMVVNVSINALNQLISKSLDQSVSFVTVTGSEGMKMFPESEVNDDTRKVMSTIVSEYTGWTYKSGLVNGNRFSILQVFSGIWFVFAAVVVLIGLLSILYMTNRNYKPLRALISKLDEMSQASATQSGNNDNEFHYIETTFHSLVERFNVFKTQSDQNINYRKKSIFLEVMNGSRSLANEEWVDELERHGFKGGFKKAAVLVASIDKYSDIRSRFTDHDLILYRFIIQNMYTELVQKSSLRSWTEWINDKEMCVFIFTQEDMPNELFDNIKPFTEHAVSWVRNNLPFTVTFGVGQVTETVPQLKNSYKSAIEAINYKFVLGSDRVIGYWEISKEYEVELYYHLERIRSMVYSFRMLEPDWRTKYNRIFTEIIADRPKRDDIVNLLHYLSFRLFDHIHGLVMNDEIVHTNKAIMKDVIEQFETLEDVQDQLLEIMEKLEYVMSEKAHNGSEQVIALEMKQYIADHLSNPDLSLVHLSEQFGISSKNVSSLFKEQFDIKFIDYLINRRVELAKQLLTETESSIQEVGYQVGYLNPVSFNRVFKRLVGITPGDYRKERHC
ncbi:AraC family transcriptional regulator [Paenibacillus aceris]|uniref:AraC-like DNA-binding protein n=1 Tax=Paenibacillus aceris TaxID=869555 RepID=A0ABS4HWT2_9BACL|nr:AraC family transcriptional regulator [Paenibacillus aceris]MBP1963100.1 AraC-like DNA-binding protein [Paenibacillus aceris]NHW38780.1 helix-turn-helix domain-containing protein [Paenibacillus aceris]